MTKRMMQRKEPRKESIIDLLIAQYSLLIVIIRS